MPRNWALLVVAPPTRAARAPSAPSLAATSARSAPAATRIASVGGEPGLGREQRRGADVGDPPAVLERAHDAADPQADLVATGRLDRQRRSRPQPERLRQPEPDLASRAGAQPPPGGERRRLEAGVVAGVADQPHRLPEPEGVGGGQLVARRGGLHAGERPHRGQPRRVQPRGQLVALADRARVVAQPHQQRGEREHQQHHAGADRDGQHGGQPAPARRERRSGPRAASSPPGPPPRARRGRRRGRRRAGSPRASGGAARQAGQAAAATTSATTAATAASSGSAQRRAGRLLVERARAATPDGPRRPARRPRRPAAAAGQRHERRLARLARGDRARARSRARAGPRSRRSRRWTSAWAPAASIVPAGEQRDERERDEQRDHDARRLESSTRTPVAGDERQRPDAERGHARLGQRDVRARRVVEPEQRDVGRISSRKSNASRTSCSPTYTRAVLREREGDVVGRQRDPGHAQVAEALEPSGSPGSRSHSCARPLLDHHLAAAAAERSWPSRDRVAAAAAEHDLDRRRGAGRGRARRAGGCR